MDAELTYVNIEPFDVVGPLTRSPIILIHSILDSKETWQSIAPGIAEATERSVYYLDCRNHGESPWTLDFTLDSMVNDIKKFLSDRECRQAILVGCGMGGIVAMKLALESPEMVEKLVVEDMIPEPYRREGWKTIIPTMRKLESALKEIPEGTGLTEVTKYLRECLKNTGGKLEYGLEAMPLKPVNGKYEWDANLDGIEEAFKKGTFDVRLTGKYEDEVCFLQSRRWFDAGQDDLILRLFPQAVRFMVPGPSRIIHAEEPAEFLRLVVEFINWVRES